jgi:hypothetical protein
MVGESRPLDPDPLRRRVSGEPATRVACPAADELPPLPGIHRHPPGEPAPGLWSYAIALVDVLEAEAGVPNKRDGVTGEMAAVGHSALEGLQAALPSGHSRIGRKAMLEKVKPASGTEHPADFRQGGIDVGNRAQGERTEGIVAGVIRQRDQLTIEPDEFDRHR